MPLAVPVALRLLCLDMIVILRWWRGGRKLGAIRDFGKNLVAGVCKMLEFSVLKWNRPSIRFYKKLGAEEKNEWSNYKFSGRALKRLASSAGDLPGESAHLNV